MRPQKSDLVLIRALLIIGLTSPESAGNAQRGKIEMSVWNKSMILTLVGLLLLASASQSTQTLQIPKYELELSFEPGAKKCSGRALVLLPPSAINDGKVSFVHLPVPGAVI